MRQLLLLGFLFLTVIVKGQNLFPEKFSDCNSEMFFLEGKEILAEKNDRELLSEIVNNMDNEILKKIKGEIFIQVKIDTVGKPCCISLKKNFNIRTDTELFKQIIDNYTTWAPPVRENKATSVCAILKLTFLKKKIKLQRLGYNTKVGIVELSSYVIKK